MFTFLLGVEVFSLTKDGELGSSSLEHPDIVRCLLFQEAIAAVRAGLPGAEEGLPGHPALHPERADGQVERQGHQPAGGRGLQAEVHVCRRAQPPHRLSGEPAALVIAVQRPRVARAPAPWLQNGRALFTIT